MKEITKERLIIATANNTRNVHCIYIAPRETFIWSIRYKPLDLIFEEYTSKEAAERYVADFIKDVKFSYGLTFKEEDFEIKEYFK